MHQTPLGIEKAREERINSNMERMKQLGILNLSCDVNSISQSLTPKKRGRPRKEKTIETSNITTKKRGRGRPRKEDRLIETSKITPTPNITPRNQWHLRTRSSEVKMDQAPLGIEKAGEERQRQIETSNKRGRGRPRKHHESTCEAPSIDTLNVKIEEVNATSEKEENERVRKLMVEIERKREEGMMLFRSFTLCACFVGYCYCAKCISFVILVLGWKVLVFFAQCF